jgi:cation diffusion facilitator CzcD-associated flavoprotein CzcO
MGQQEPRHVHVAIVGSGFAGLGAAIRLRQEGIRDFVVLERAMDVGGTWRDNSYPGCACDVESHLYSFSFAPNPTWSRSFSPRREIWAYLKRCAREFDLLPHLRFGHAVQQSVWDDTAKLWRIETSAGRYTADFLVGGMGAFSEPAMPALPGLERFAGKVFHSARWDHGYDLTDRKVAVVGTGASAIQFVPAIQPKVRKLTLFQRTPAWIIPRFDRPVSVRAQKLFGALPSAQKALRSLIYARRELFVLGFRNPSVMKLLEQLARGFLRLQVADPALREKLTPSYRIGCKRILLSDDYYPALTQSNVEVVTSGIREVRAHSVVDEAGVEHELDAIVFGTGFKVTDMPFADQVVGRTGETLNAYWRGSPKAHLGTMVSSFPNLFLLLGPNTGLGHTSVVLMIESQIELLIAALRHVREHGVRTLEPSEPAEREFVHKVDRAMRGTVWTAGSCASWYIDRTGRNSTLWPSFTFSFRQQLRFRPAEYRFGTSVAGPVGVRARASGLDERDQRVLA